MKKISLIISAFILALLVSPIVGLAAQIQTNVYVHNSTTGLPAMFADKIVIYNSTGYYNPCTNCKSLLGWLESGKTYYVNITKAGYTPLLAQAITVPSTGPVKRYYYMSLDTQNPAYSSEDTTPDSPATYAKDANYNFKITWTDNNAVDDVKLTFNGISYWYPGQLTKSGSVYSLSLSDLAAKTYAYQWWANDTAGKTAQTGSLSYIINKAANAASLLINGNAQDVTTTYPDSKHTITASAPANLVKLMYGTTDWTAKSGVQQDLKAGTYVFKATTTGNENYTADSTGVTRTLTINKADQPVSLVITPSESVIYPNQTTATATLTSGTGTFTLERDSTVVSSPETATLGAGTYEYNASAAGNENYTANFIEKTLTVEQYPTTATLTLYSVAGGSLELSPSGPTRGDDDTETANLHTPRVGASGNGVGSMRNSGTGMTDSNSINPIDNDFDMELPDTEKEIDTDGGTRADDASIDYGTKIKATCTEDNEEETGKLLRNTNDVTSSEADKDILFAAGSHNYNCTVDGTQNYTADFDAATLTINKADTIVGLYITGVDSDNGNLYAYHGTAISVTADVDNINDEGISGFKLYRDSNVVDQGKADLKDPQTLLPVGFYDFDTSFTATQNYTGVSTGLPSTVEIRKQITNDPQSPLMHLALNDNTTHDQRVAFGQQSNVTGWKDFSEGTLTLYRDNVQIVSGQTPSEVRSDLGIGIYNYTLDYPATENYTAGTITRWLTIFESEAPTWSENKSDTPSVYTTTPSEFEMTWEDNMAVDEVIFEMNVSNVLTNYSYKSGQVIRASGDAQDGQYEFNSTLTSGTHCWKSYANDTSDNWNTTDTWCFTIAKDGQATVNLYLDSTEGNITVQYLDTINLTATTDMGDIDVYASGPYGSGLTASGNATNPVSVDRLMDAVGLWNLTAVVSDTVSYDGDSVTWFVNVTKKDVDDPNDPVMHIAINDTEADREMGIKEAINVTAWTDINDATSAILYRTNSTNTVNLGTVTGTTPLSDIIAADTLPKGRYNYTLVYPGSANYNAGSVTRWLTINRTNITDPQNPMLHLELNGSESNLTIPEGTQSNATGFRDFSEGGNITLYRNGIAVDNSAMKVSEIRNLPKALYNYTVYFPGSENYTDGSVTYFVNVTKRDPVQDGSLEAWLNGTSGNISGVVHYPGETSIVVNATSWTNITGSTLTIYRNGFNLGTKYATTNDTSFVIEDSVGPGLHNYTFVIDETTNYAAGSITLWANITAEYNWTKELKSGWNLISLPVIPSSPVLTSDGTIWGTTYVIQHYNSTTENWYEYNSTSPGSANLTSVEPNWGYWIYVANDQTININGTVPSTTTVSLKEGLNMVGWTSAKRTLMNDALASIIDDVDFVDCQDTVGARNVSQCYPPAGNSFEVGKGYFINMTSDSDWNYTDNFPPVADAGPDITQHSKKVRLDASDSYDPDGTITAHRWIFEDGTFVDGSVVDHNFLDDGVFNVTLIVQDNDGATDTDEIIVTIGTAARGSGGSFSPHPKLSMFISAPKEVNIAPGETKEITFTVKSTGQADIFDVEVDVDGPSDWLSEDSFGEDNIKTGKSESFSFEVTVPEDEEEGTETITVSASANGVEAEDIDIILNIKAEAVVPDTGDDDGGDTGPTGLFLLEPNVIAGLAVILLLAIGAGYHYGKKGKTPTTATSKTTQLEATSETPKTPESSKKGSGAEFSIEYK